MVLIDPPYELDHEYADVVKAVVDGIKRWATGTFAIWYPVVHSDDVDFLAAQAFQRRAAGNVTDRAQCTAGEITVLA